MQGTATAVEGSESGIWSHLTFASWRQWTTLSPSLQNTQLTQKDLAWVRVTILSKSDSLFPQQSVLPRWLLKTAQCESLVQIRRGWKMEREGGASRRRRTWSTRRRSPWRTRAWTREDGLGLSSLVSRSLIFNKIHNIVFTGRRCSKCDNGQWSWWHWLSWLLFCPS